MQKNRRNFLIFIVVWLGVLDYLIITRSTINSPLLSSLSKPFYRLFTGNVTGSVINGNHLFSLIIINVVVVILFYMTYIRIRAKKK